MSSLGISINKRGEEQVRIVLRLLYLIRQVHFTFVCSLSNCLDQVHHPDPRPLAHFEPEAPFLCQTSRKKEKKNFINQTQLGVGAPLNVPNSARH